MEDYDDDDDDDNVDVCGSENEEIPTKKREDFRRFVGADSRNQIYNCKLIKASVFCIGTIYVRNTADFLNYNCNFVFKIYASRRSSSVTSEVSTGYTDWTLGFKLAQPEWGIGSLFSMATSVQTANGIPIVIQ